jgi:hypothetical protein
MAYLENVLSLEKVQWSAEHVEVGGGNSHGRSAQKAIRRWVESQPALPGLQSD